MDEPFLCPGCGKDMTEFMAHEAHYADETKMGQTIDWPWTALNAGPHAIGTICPWTRDYLSAEVLRRHPQPWSYT